MFKRINNRFPNDNLYKENNRFFVTICTFNKECLFSEIDHDGGINPPLHLNKIGQIVKYVRIDLEKVFENIILDEYVIMPNHFHGIIGFEGTPRKIKDNKNVNLSEIIGYFKGYTQKLIRDKIASVAEGLSLHSSNNYNKIRQKSFHDHIIRDNKDLLRIQKYIIENPLKRENDIL